ncbi:membrane protein [Candidatus Rhodobacter oscarellae]|uniref:Membrane protein n=1 Tax=Candidatus Rhodobacter oscarellae TaxID=1675527 RepID=A0A0J9E8Y7_9RHOB|nr:DUF3429 domain-containing protein [Candidatus Rhodobacter lobularis]KMW59255.1 membrane protein [Candidatus Rhodobacter lobularis]
MMGILRTALILGLAGVLPFFAAGLLAQFAESREVQQLAHATLSLYGVMILGFMSGCIWAFAAKDNDPMGYALSTVPALFGFMVPIFPVYFGLIEPKEALFYLAAGFLVLLGLDLRAWRKGQTPPWWVWLRVLLTALVVPSILLGAFA